jgi:effector-binding domain-containing protein
MAYHYGSYDKLGDTHTAIHKWMEENGKTPAGAPWEVYIKNPMQVKDFSELVTEVYYPIQ